MTVETKSYDARDIIITWGEVELEGATDGTFVVIEYDEDAVKKHTGAQGDVTVTISANDGGSVTWTGNQGTPTHDRLSAIAALQRKKGVGLIKKPILVKHTNGNTLVVGPEAWIKKVPKTEFGAEHNPREWIFDIAHLNLFVGSSNR